VPDRQPRSRAGLVPDQPAGSTRTLLSPGGPDGALGDVRRTVLPGGLRVISERMPGVRSVTVGVWVGVGSRDEPPSLAGATHYLEHLLFKGTARRNAEAISGAVEAVGGELNAFTTKEYTCYYTHTLDQDLPLALDVLGDMLTGSLLTAEDVEAERSVVLEELAMHDDDPTDAAHELLAAGLWGAGPLGRPIVGTAESVGALRRDQLRRWYRSRYTAPNIVVAAAGNLTHDALVAEVVTAFGVPAGGDGDGPPPNPPRPVRNPPRTAATVAFRRRRTEQANLVVGLPGLGRTDPRYPALRALDAVVGGGMASRLFVEVRERRGLAYSVHSFVTGYTDGGMWGVYAGCQPRRAAAVLGVVREQLALVAAAGISPDELARAQGQLRGALVLGLEDTASRMTRLGKAELVQGELPTLDELLARIDAVTVDEVAALAAELLRRPPALAVVGPYDDVADLAAALR
jgi:predicted Zn-dependent peptidase